MLTMFALKMTISVSVSWLGGEGMLVRCVWKYRKKFFFFFFFFADPRFEGHQCHLFTAVGSRCLRTFAC